MEHAEQAITAVESSMRVIIAGSRSLKDKALVHKAVEALRERCGGITEVVSGGAMGIDLLGEQEAARQGIPVRRFPADWKTHGKRAGFLRNIDMAEYADALIAVWDGKSRGTRHMIEQMCQRGSFEFTTYGSRHATYIVVKAKPR